jgi:cell division protein FtsL
MKGHDYQIKTINLGLVSRDQKIDNLQGSISFIIQKILMNQSTMEDLKQQVVGLTTYIHQWTKNVEEAPMT